MIEYRLKQIIKICFWIPVSSSIFMNSSSPIAVRSMEMEYYLTAQTFIIILWVVLLDDSYFKQFS